MQTKYPYTYNKKSVLSSLGSLQAAEEREQTTHIEQEADSNQQQHAEGAASADLRKQSEEERGAGVVDGSVKQV